MNDPLPLVLVTTTTGVPWTVTCLLAGALPIEKHRVTVAAVGPPPGPDARAELMQLAPHASLAVLEGPSDRDREPWPELEGARARVALLCERVKPRVVHSNHLLLGAVPCEAPRVVTVAADLVSWTRSTGKSPEVDLVRYRALMKQTLAHASVVVAPSACFAREIERSYKLAESARVIRSGVPPAPRQAVDRGLVAVASGALDDPGRHLDWLVAAAARLPGPVGVIGANVRSLPRPLQALGALGFRDRLALLAGTKVFLGLARFDYFGLEAAEANAAGARLVLADNATHRELFRSIAELVRDPESLAHAVVRAHAAPKLARPATPLYPIAQTAAAYSRLFEELAGAL